MNKKQEFNKFYLMLTLLGMVILGVVLLGAMVILKGAQEINTYTGGSIIVALIIMVFAIYLVIKRKKEISQGFPQHDERSRKIMNLAAARAFYISIYWVLGLMWLDILTEKMPVNAALGIAIMGMALIWMACQFYYNKYGDKHL